VYNFTYLDALMDLLYENGLKPGFELMGNPGNMYKNFDDKTAVFDWRDLVTQTAKRYVGKGNNKLTLYEEYGYSKLFVLIIQ